MIRSNCGWNETPKCPSRTHCSPDRAGKWASVLRHQEDGGKVERKRFFYVLLTLLAHPSREHLLELTLLNQIVVLQTIHESQRKTLDYTNLFEVHSAFG